MFLKITKSHQSYTYANILIVQRFYLVQKLCREWGAFGSHDDSSSDCCKPCAYHESKFSIVCWFHCMCWSFKDGPISLNERMSLICNVCASVSKVRKELSEIIKVTHNLYNSLTQRDVIFLRSFDFIDFGIYIQFY